MWIHPEAKSPQDKYTYGSYHCSTDKSYAYLRSISFDPTEFPTNSIVYPITRHVSVITYIVRWLSPETDWLDIVMLGLAVWTGMPGEPKGYIIVDGWLFIDGWSIRPDQSEHSYCCQKVHHLIPITFSILELREYYLYPYWMVCFVLPPKPTLWSWRQHSRAFEWS